MSSDGLELGRFAPEAERRALQHCAKVTAGSGSNFYLAFLPLPRPRRQGIFCVYAFCRHVDDVVDEPAPGTDQRAELDAWRRRVEAIARGTLREDDHPIAVGLALTHARYPLRAEDLMAVIDGVAMDLDRRRPETAEDLALYCERVAGRVGCLCLPVFGASDRSRDYALTLGQAFQLTNILRDVPRDARQGRVYLPVEHMRRFGVSDEDLAAAKPRPEVLALLEHEANRAEALFRRAEDAMVLEDRPYLYPAQIMAAIYRRLLDTFRASGHDPWERRPQLPAHVKATLALGVWLRDRVLHLS